MKNVFLCVCVWCNEMLLCTRKSFKKLWCIASQLESVMLVYEFDLFFPQHYSIKSIQINCICGNLFDFDFIHDPSSIKSLKFPISFPKELFNLRFMCDKNERIGQINCCLFASNLTITKFKWKHKPTIQRSLRVSDFR